MYPRIVAVIVALTATPQFAPPAAAAVRAVEPIAESDVERPPVGSPLPGLPRSVRVTLTSEGRVVSWQRPTSSGTSPLTGFVVLADDKPTHVDASTRRLVLHGSPSRVAVAAVNETGCSLAAPPLALARELGRRPVEARTLSAVSGVPPRGATARKPVRRAPQALSSSRPRAPR